MSDEKKLEDMFLGLGPKPAPDSIVEFFRSRKSGSRIYYEKIKMKYSEYEKELKEDHNKMLEEQREKREYMEKCRNVSVGTYCSKVA